MSTGPSSRSKTAERGIIGARVRSGSGSGLAVPRIIGHLNVIFFLLVFGLNVAVFVFLLANVVLFSRVLFVVCTVFLPVDFLLSVVPACRGVTGRTIIHIFGTVVAETKVALVIAITFSVSDVFCGVSASCPFFVITFLRVVYFTKVCVGLKRLVDVFDLGTGSDRRVNHQVFHEPVIFVQRQTEHVRHQLTETINAKDVIKTNTNTITNSTCGRSHSARGGAPTEPREGGSISVKDHINSTINTIVSAGGGIHSDTSSLGRGIGSLPARTNCTIRSTGRGTGSGMSSFGHNIIRRERGQRRRHARGHGLRERGVSRGGRRLRGTRRTERGIRTGKSTATKTAEDRRHPITAPIPGAMRASAIVGPSVGHPTASPIVGGTRIGTKGRAIQAGVERRRRIGNIAEAGRPGMIRSEDGRGGAAVRGRIGRGRGHGAIAGRPRGKQGG